MILLVKYNLRARKTNTIVAVSYFVPDNPRLCDVISEKLAYCGSNNTLIVDYLWWNLWKKLYGNSYVKVYICKVLALISRLISTYDICPSISNIYADDAHFVLI